MYLHVSSDHGHFFIGEYGFNWANPDHSLDLPGFFCINLGQMSIEFGEIDQGRPGIYITTYKDEEVDTRQTLWTVK